jgi:hypothetical protein
MRLAYYKGTRPGIQGLFNIAVRLWCRGKYSHVELIFSDGLSGSSSGIDGGVRLKQIDYNPSRWDIVKVNADEAFARQYVEGRVGWGYDYWGLFGFILRPFRGDKKREFCSEIIAGALKINDPWRFDPCSLAAVHGLQP